MKTLRVLVLEDDLETLGVIMGVLNAVEKELLKNENKRDVAVTVFSEYTLVEDFVNKLINPNFDLVLLDRDCKLGGSFHALDLDKFGKDKIIGISSVPDYNNSLLGVGVEITINKDYSDLVNFGNRLEEVLVLKLKG